MGLQQFDPTDGIFEDEEVLRDSHTPDELPARDEQLREYQDALKPVIKGSRPKNIFLVGQTGVGKTVATQMIRNQFTEDQKQYDHVDAHFVYLNCNNLNSSYRVAANLVNKFREPDDKINTTGYPADEIYTKLYEELRDLDATHVMFILDEIDNIGTDDNILYNLPRCNDNKIDPEEIYVGVIGISNDFTFRDNLRSKVKDTLCEEEIHFPPYDAGELKTIIRERADDAFVDDVLDNSAIELVGAMAGNESGSARRALDLLYKAGDLARRNGDDVVDESYVREAEPLVRKNKVREELERLPTQSHLVLRALLKLHETDQTPAKSQTIYEEYLGTCEHLDKASKTQRTIRDRLGQLSLKGFVACERRNEGKGSGRYHLYELGDVDPEMIHEILETELGSNTTLDEFN